MIIFFNVLIIYPNLEASSLRETVLFQIDTQTFQATVSKLNAMYEKAETLNGQTYCESCLACLTAYLSYICISTHYEKVPAWAAMLSVKLYIFQADVSTTCLSDHLKWHLVQQRAGYYVIPWCIMLYWPIKRHMQWLR